MDDDEEDRDFSKGIVFGFFDQADATFKSMDKALSVERPTPMPACDNAVY